MGKTTNNKNLYFNDADTASKYALEALYWITENGILNGYSNLIVQQFVQKLLKC